MFSKNVAAVVEDTTLMLVRSDDGLLFHVYVCHAGVAGSPELEHRRSALPRTSAVTAQQLGLRQQAQHQQRTKQP